MGGLALDAGAATVRAWVPGRRQLYRAPAALAVHCTTGQVVATFARAQALVGRTPPDVEVAWPFSPSIAHEGGAVRLLAEVLARVRPRGLLRPRVAVGMPAASTPLEQQALEAAVRDAGAHAVDVVVESLAAAHAFGLPVWAPRGTLVVDVGASAAHIDLLSLGEPVSAVAVTAAGGDAADAAVARAVEEHLGVLIGPRTAERLKRELSHALGEASGSAEVTGLDRATRRPKAVTVPASLVHEAMLPGLRSLVQGIGRVLEGVSPELAGDVAATDVLLTGGMARTAGLAEYLARETGLTVVPDPEPEDRVVQGLGKLLEEGKGRREVGGRVRPSG